MKERQSLVTSAATNERNLTRRSFIGTVAGAAALGQVGTMSAGAELETSKRPLVISTWPFG